MRKDSKSSLDWFNEMLSRFDIDFVCVSYDVNTLTLSNGVILNRSDLVKLRRRLVGMCTENSMITPKNINDLYSGDSYKVTNAEKEIKQNTASLGGKRLMSSENGKLTIERAKKNISSFTSTHAFKKGHQPWNKNLTKENNKIVRNMAEKRTGPDNWMFGRKMSQENKELRSQTMIKMISDGDFTPNVMNHLTRKNIEYNGKKYRSSWEVIFAFHNPDYDYETLRIPYRFDDKNRIYLVDFVNHNTRVVCEIKPHSMKQNHKNNAKRDALGLWCVENGYTMVEVDEDDIGTLVEKTPISILEIFTIDTRKSLKKLIK